MTYAAGVEDPDGDQAGLLGHTIRLTADGASNMGAVSDQVNKLRIWVRVVAQGRAPRKLGVRRQQTGIDDVSIGANTAFSVIDVIGRVLRLVGDAPETPRRISLCGQLVELPYGILLHSGDLGGC